MASNNRHSYVQFYPSDWLAGLAFMPPMAEWLYLQVCLYNWDKREPMPATEVRIRLHRHADWESDLQLLLDAGKVVKTASGGLFVHRAIVEANKAFELWEKKSRGGRNRQASQSQGENETGGKSDGNTHDKSAASNENENENENEIDPSGSRAGSLFFAIPAEAMSSFREHRRKIKAPMTKRAEELIVRKLEEIHREHGHDPTKVMEQSILNGWRGVFPIKGAGNGNGNRNGGSNGLLDACTE